MKVSVLLVALAALASCSVERNGRIIDHVAYFNKLVQETVYEWEQRGFCILTLNEFTRPINVEMYGWQVFGNVTYTNAFLNSIQKLEVGTVSQRLGRRTVNGEQFPFATIRGTLFLRDSVYGYDVIFDQLDVGQHRFTGKYGYTRTEIELEILKNMITNKLSTTMILRNLSGGDRRMVFFPDNNITEVLSREFSPVTTFDSIDNWGRNTLAPMMLKIAQTKLDFPKICYSNDINC